MYEIKSEMCLLEDFEAPIFSKGISQCKKKVARHKLITVVHLASKVKVETPLGWPTIFSISEVSELKPLHIWVQIAKLDHFVRCSWQTEHTDIIYGFDGPSKYHQTKYSN